MMDRRLTIGQINARHSPPVMELLGIIITERHIDLLLIQEPPLTLVRREWTLRGYRVFLATGDKPLTAIMVKSCVSSSAINITGPRICGCVVNTCVGDLWVFSSYVKYTTSEGLEQLSIGLNLAASKTKFRLVGMDSNGHSPLWGPNTTRLDQVGRNVEAVLAEGNMLVLNSNESPPTYVGDHDQHSWIDVTAASPSLASRVNSWTVCASTYVASDHRLLQTVIDLAPSRAKERRVPDWFRTNWHLFSHTLQSLLGLAPDHLITTTTELDCVVDHVTDCIQETMRQTVPQKRLCQFSRPWWHPGLSSSRSEMNHWRRRWTRTGRVYARERFLRARQTFRRDLVIAKRDSWRRLCSDTSFDDMWTLYKKFTRRGDLAVVEHLEHNDQIIVSDEGKAAALASVFFPPLRPATLKIQEDIDFAWSTHRPPGDPSAVTVTVDEVTKAIKSMKRKAAPGLDLITVEVFRTKWGFM